MREALLSAEGSYDPATETRGSRRLLGWVIALWVVLGLVFLVATWSRRWMSDDGFINLRIVQNIFNGHGPVFNVGERVEVGTSPLWLVALFAGRVATGGMVDLEWVAVGVGILASIATVTVVATTQWKMWAGPVVPAAILAWLSLGSVWDFSTSGLEGPLLWLWLAACFGALAIRAVAPHELPAWRPAWIPMLIGLGPLIRPDASVYTVAFLVALVIVSARAWRGIIASIAIAAALPCVFEVFRVGYFGSLVPNTALAKEAGASNVHAGLRYLLDFQSVGWLIIPFAVIIGTTGTLIATGAVASRLARLWLVSYGASVVHVVWVVRLGGDFMHARLLLPDWLLLLLPLAAIPIGLLSTVLIRVALGILIIWSAVVAGLVRSPMKSEVSPFVMDERAAYTTWIGSSNPVTVADWSQWWGKWVQTGESARARAKDGQDVVIFPAAPPDRRSLRSVGGTYLVIGNIGVIGYAAGDQVHIIDRIGLSDPLASRFPTEPDARVGHAKWLSEPWIEGRFVDPIDFRSAGSSEASEALECPPLNRLINSVTAPMTPKQFLINMWRAPALTILRVPSNPSEAVEELCD